MPGLSLAEQCLNDRSATPDALEAAWQSLVREAVANEHCIVFGGAPRYLAEHPSYLFAEPVVVVRSLHGAVEVQRAGGLARVSTDWRTALRNELLEPLSKMQGGSLAAIPFVAGFISYEHLHALERVPVTPVDPFCLPDFSFALFRRVYRRTVVDSRLSVERFELPLITGTALWELQNPSAPQPATAVPSSRTLSAPTAPTREIYIAAVEEARRQIARGRIYQVNLAQCFKVAAPINPHALFFAQQQVNPARHCALVSLPSIQRWLVSASPETFFKKSGTTITCSPIKGTRGQGKSSTEDRAIEELRNSSKENAELAMIVDLTRNDLSRIAVPGTVRVTAAPRIDSISFLHHLVQDVTATIDPRYDLIDIFSALFPCSSVTGAPKIAAMKLIAETEQQARGVYTGAIGWISAEDALFSVAIRTATVTPHELYYQTGAGIVWDSDPVAEYEETLLKAEGMFASLRAVGHRL